MVVRDDLQQAEAGAAFVASGAWVSHLVLAEALWVLSSVYGVNDRELATTVAMLLEHEQIAIQDADVVRAALADFRQHPKVEFTDCMIVAIARKAGHGPVGTFDKALAQVDQVTGL